MMVAVGRTTSAASIIGVSLLFTSAILSNTGVAPEMLPRGVAAMVGATTALSAFVSWPLALYHWGTRFSGPARDRRWWGRALVLGAFLSAWAYWLTRGRSDEAEV
jgi:hypothetical protein